MSEQEKMEETFDLEDILKEFADEPADESALEEDVLIWDGVMPEQPSAAPWSKEDTVRLEEVTKAVKELEQSVMEKTIAFTPVELPQQGQELELEQTVRFTPVGQAEEEEYIAVAPQGPSVEPYSDSWEPEYEQPIAEYVPAEPIVFRPKSRLRELKRQLIAGPEKRYYELTEQGVGKLQIAMILNLLVALFAVGNTVMFSLGYLGENREKFVIFSQFLSLLLSALLGSYQLLDGFRDMVKKRFSLNSLLWFSLLACLADGLLCLQQLRVPCCAAFSLNMTMSLWSTYQKRVTELGQMDTMRKATRLDSVVGRPDYYEGRVGFLRSEGKVEDFMNHYREASGLERVLSGYALAAVLVSVAIAVAAGIRYGFYMAIQSFACALLIAVPATAYISLSRPMAVLERRLHKVGAVLCGWGGVTGLSANGVFPVHDEDLFPAGAAKMNGVKFYGHRDPDEVVAYAAALICAGGGGLAPLFAQLLDSRNGHHYDAEGFRGYPGGMGAGINGEAVLAGTLEFMQDMGVDMPEGARVSQAIYVAVDGRLCGVFAISYGKIKSAARGILTLTAYRGLTPIMVGNDVMLTESFLHSKFGVNSRQIAFPSRKIRQELLQITPGQEDKALALTTQEGLAASAYAVTGARALHTASKLGVIVHMLGGILGLAMMLVLALVGAEYLLTPENVLLYELFWMIPGFLVTEWTRSV